MTIFDEYRSGAFNNLKASISWGTFIQLVNMLTEDGNDINQIALEMEQLGSFYVKQRSIHTTDLETDFSKTALTNRYNLVTEGESVRAKLNVKVRNVLVI
jgi:hypothetical protein